MKITTKIVSDLPTKVSDIQTTTVPLKKRVPFEPKQAFKHYRPRCFKCNKARRYENPLAKCWECKNKFCYNHINCLQVNDTMKQTEEVRHICDKCKEEHRYRTLGNEKEENGTMCRKYPELSDDKWPQNYY